MACIDEYRFVCKDIKLFIPIDKIKFYSFKPVYSVGSPMSYPDHLNQHLSIYLHFCITEGACMDKILTFEILHDLDGIPIKLSFILLANTNATRGKGLKL